MPDINISLSISSMVMDGNINRVVSGDDTVSNSRNVCDTLSRSFPHWYSGLS